MSEQLELLEIPKRIIVRYKRLRSDAQPPTKGSAHAAAFDFRYVGDRIITIPQFASAVLPTGLALELPVGYDLLFVPRSGLFSKSRLIGLGLVDCDYRGEIGVMLINIGHPVQFAPGDRVGQGKIGLPGQEVAFEEGELSSTERGSGGFGSTGISG